jgi:hypothetical protein
MKRHKKSLLEQQAAGLIFKFITTQAVLIDFEISHQ